MPIFRPLPVMTVASIAAFAVLIGLGVWQIQRRAEKHAFLAEVEAKAKTEPVPLEQGLASADPRYIRVQIDLPSNCAAQALVNDFRIWGEKTVLGGDLVTPVKMANGSWLMVARGFLPDEILKERGGRIEGISCPSNLRGVAVLTPASSGGWFAPKADHAARRWYAYDAKDMAEANGLSPVAPWIARLERDRDPEPDTWPMPETYAADIPDNHLIYALTWFGLALTLVGVYAAYHIAAGRLRFRP